MTPPNNSLTESTVWGWMARRFTVNNPGVASNAGGCAGGGAVINVDAVMDLGPFYPPHNNFWFSGSGLNLAKSLGTWCGQPGTVFLVHYTSSTMRVWWEHDFDVHATYTCDIEDFEPVSGTSVFTRIVGDPAIWPATITERRMRDVESP